MTAAPDAARTEAMSVKNIGFMVDRLGQDTAPLQYVRELTQNAIQAVLRTPEGKGDVIWDIDLAYLRLEGVRKLACIDNGVGMDGSELREYMNQLSSSVEQQAHNANFGVGAKIAALTRNHAGMTYISWKSGEGVVAQLWRDPETGEYGLRPQALPDSSYGYWARLDPHYEGEIKPGVISDHGTMVVLLGNEEDVDTTIPPPGTPQPSNWVARYLNSRYFRLPDDVNVRSRDLVEDGSLRRVTGQEHFLNANSLSRGAVQLPGASAHWWVMKEGPRENRNLWYVYGGHVAALFQDELYEMQTARSGAYRLQQFGVFVGYNRVVVYIEPDAGEDLVTSNTARTSLILNGEPLPWEQWAASFRAQMPSEITQLMDEVAARSSGTDFAQSIRERLKSIHDLFKVSRYRRTPAGSVLVSGSAEGGVARESNATRKAGGRHGGGAGGKAGNLYALFIAENADPANEVRGVSEPEVVWVSVADGTRIPPTLDDRAASYIPDVNMLQINKDFRIYQDTVDRWVERYNHVPGARPPIEAAVQEWLQQALMETVMGLQALKGSPEWPPAALDRAWSEEALTAAVMQRYHIELAVKRALGAKLGSLKESAGDVA